MIHTVYLDNEYVAEMKNVHYKQDVRFENSVVSDIAPEEYMTSEEFRKRAIAKVNKFCDEHGLL